MLHQSYCSLTSELSSIHLIILSNPLYPAQILLLLHIFPLNVSEHLSPELILPPSIKRLLSNLFTFPSLLFNISYHLPLITTSCHMHCYLSNQNKSRLLKLDSNCCFTTLTSSTVLSPILPPLFP